LRDNFLDDKPFGQGNADEAPSLRKRVGLQNHIDIVNSTEYIPRRQTRMKIGMDRRVPIFRKRGAVFPWIVLLVSLLMAACSPGNSAGGSRRV
jgi:hypothetical protein